MASGYQLHIFPFLIPFSIFSRAYDHLHKAFSLTWHRLTGWLVTCFPALFTIAWLVTCQCFPALFTIAWLATCFPALFTIAWSLTSYALFAILYSVASFPALFIIAWLVTCFLRISPWFIRLHVFQRFSPLVNWLQVYPRFSPLLYWLHVFPRSLPTLVPFQVYPLFSALLDWLHAVLRFSPVSDHCLTGCVFLRFSPLLDPGSKISLACRANRASQNLKLSSLFFRTLKGYRENWGTVKALTFSRLRIVAICVSLANLSLIVHWVTAVK